MKCFECRSTYVYIHYKYFSNTLKIISSQNVCKSEKLEHQKKKSTGLKILDFYFISDIVNKLSRVGSKNMGGVGKQKNTYILFWLSTYTTESVEQGVYLSLPCKTVIKCIFQHKF